MPTCFMLIGLPGSGKSTLVNDIKKTNPEVIVISSDMFIEKYALEQNKTYSEVYSEYIKEAIKKFNSEVQNLIKNKKDFILDQTNLVKSARMKKIKNLKLNGYNVYGLVMDLSKEEHDKRVNKRTSEGGKIISEKVIENMINSYQKPELSEGFNSITFIKDDCSFEEIKLPIAKRNGLII